MKGRRSEAVENALEVNGLTKDYGDFRLRQVTFSLPSGYIMGLIGPNGAGKTTVIKLILNLLRRDGGSVRIFGRDNLSSEVEIKSRLGFVHDAPIFYEYLTLKKLKDTVAPFYQSWDDRAFLRLIEEFDLPLGKRFSRLSRGMKMKFALALALSHRADLLILDEPTSGLDPVFRRELLAKLSAFIHDEGKSVLFSTHITSDLERIADFVTFIHNGEVVFSSPRDEILEKWAVVKGGPELLAEEYRRLFRGIRRREFVVQALTADGEKARRSLPKDVLVEKASLEDIMFYLTRGNGHA
jgi:ABC-2 type transport system ATP-binding protein